MKKLLALLLVIAMVFGAFVPAFAATEAEMTAEAKLLELGIMNDDRADDSLTRAEMVVLLSRLLGEEAAAKDFPVAPSFADATGHWGANYIAWAESMAYVQGNEDGTFAPDAFVTSEQMELVLNRALGYADGEGVEIPVTGEFTRGAAATMIVYALDLEMADGSQTLAAKLGMVADLAIVSAEQTNKDEFTITFNQAVTEGTFSVMRGKVVTAVEEVVFDGSTATVTMEREIRKDFDYKLTFGTLEATVAGQESEVTSIEFPYEYANLKSYTESTHAIVYYDVKDQFGNDVTSKNNVSFYTIGGTQTKNTGELDIPNAAAPWLMGTPLVVNAVYNDNAGNVVTATKTFEIAGPIKLSELALGDVQNIGAKDDQQILKDKATGENDKKDYFWVMPVTALNQYGDAVPKAYFDALSNELTDSGVTTEWYKDDDGNVFLKLLYFADSSTIDLAANTTAFVTVVDTNSGLNATKTFDIPKAGISDFKVLGPVDEVIGAEKAEFEFEAYDAYGNEITAYSTIDNLTENQIKVNGANVLLSPTTPAAGTWFFKEDVLSGTAKLYFQADTNTSAYAAPQYATFTINNKVSQVSFNVSKDRETEAILGLDEDAPNLIYVVGNHDSAGYEFNEGDFVFVDQYGKETNATDLKVNFIEGTTDLNATSATVHVAPETTPATVKYTVQIIDESANPDKVVDEYEFDVKFIAQDDVDSVEVTEVGTLYAQASGPVVDLYKTEIKLSAKVDGSDATMPTASSLGLEITPLGGDVATAATNKVFSQDDEDPAALKDDTTYTRTVLVKYTFNEKPVTEAQEVTIDTTAPKAESIEVKIDADLANAELDGNVLAIAKGELKEFNIFDNSAATNMFFFELENQYGVHDPADVAYAYITVDKLGTGSTADYDVVNSGTGVGNFSFDGLYGTGGTKVAATGDEFTITVVTDSGLTSTLKVEVK